ncbi:TIM-barrel domain-containing protein [Mycobacterium sp. 3519A]|uniref:TIM-barrel domain-containing protein n=1 Tax=Mycobacterium sp. 3519A TaxID=2057184 RepID=UPI00190EB2B1|nr:TIM-barrel domain-containing protein [Mycobacterium sp. 3519A]
MRTRPAALAIVMSAVLILALAWAAGCAVRRTNGEQHHRIPTVTSGSARFQVLSPTLIRTEYASDRKFVDGPTFNVVGRNAFPVTAYTTTSVDGWLTIATSAMTLRYKTDSGPFTPRNLIVHLKAGGQDVTATPWQRPTCVVGVVCEAEDLTPVGAQAAHDHPGYSGAGYLAGDGLEADVDIESPGRYQFIVRYAKAGVGAFTLGVDGYPAQTTNLAPTADWATAAVPLDLAKGHHQLSLSDSGPVAIDSVALVAPGAPPPTMVRHPLVDCQFNVTCEAERLGRSGAAAVAGDRPGYSGTGFVTGLNPNSDLLIRAVGVPSDARYTLHVRYANGGPVTLTVGGVTRTVALPPTDDRTTWGTARIPVTLRAGTSDVAVGCPDAEGCGVTVDAVAVTSEGAGMPAPHIPLGGYRRSLDGVNGDNGAPLTTPGLLHRDGWYLLDDSASALFDTTTNELSPRPQNRGAHLDGYLFGYGADYKRGLSDLATLTGPPALLPPWAYGVWYSENIDRTADELQNDVVSRFRSEGVPLDVLVVDTDYKTPDHWNGWQIDTGKFPDPEGFFDWAKTQGLQTVLNVHPSISKTDPRLPEAQATAHNRLRSADCPAPGGRQCYVFDWADPDQLQAYLNLQQTMERLGNHYWWLDWCCEGAEVSPLGATPDAWISQQYAETAEKGGRRGFVLSRTYGSPRSGASGMPTGPWADKRTTIHFTGDTYSTWGTLAGEVGWTPAESVATGLSAVSHDIGGQLDTGGLAGSELEAYGRRTTKLSDDLYARWVQLGTFQPIDRLHGDHSDRLPWQYGPAAQASAKKFLNLRARLVPYLYTLADAANRTGLPVVRPLYLEYPDQPQAYAFADTEYLFGPDVLVAPVTTPGDRVTRTVWLPPGQWTNFFTGETLQGGTTHQVSSGLDTMPVFVKSGAVIATRTDDTANSAAPLTGVTLNVAEGAPGTFTLYEDDGTGGRNRRGATTRIDYTESPDEHTISIGSTDGSFRDQAGERQWTISVLNTAAPTSVTVNGSEVAPSDYAWNGATRNLRITLPVSSIQEAVTVSYR